MATNVKHSLVYARFSTVSVAAALDDATAKVLLCEVDLSWDSTATVSEAETKNCGTFKVAGSPSNTISGAGIVAGDLGANEVSSQQLMIWLNNQATVFYALFNITDGGTIAANEVAYRTGSGYFSKVGETWNTGDKMGKFSYEFVPNGVPDFTP